jgi:hypothetical protein
VEGHGKVNARGYYLDIKNPHTAACDHGDLELIIAEFGRDASPSLR